MKAVDVLDLVVPPLTRGRSRRDALAVLARLADIDRALLRAMTSSVATLTLAHLSATLTVRARAAIIGVAKAGQDEQFRLVAREYCDVREDLTRAILQPAADPGEGAGGPGKRPPRLVRVRPPRLGRHAQRQRRQVMERDDNVVFVERFAGASTQRRKAAAPAGPREQSGEDRLDRGGDRGVTQLRPRHAVEVEKRAADPAPAGLVEQRHHMVDPRAASLGEPHHVALVDGHPAGSRFDHPARSPP
jgi:hypothetical protein